MRKFRSLFVSIVLITILAMSLFLCSCHDDDEPNNQDWIKIYTCDKLNLKNDNCYTIAYSVEDIMTICDENTSPIFEEDKYGKEYYIIEKLKEYNEEFFIDKTLVILFRVRNDAGTYYYVKDFDINDNSLNITLARDLPKEPIIAPMVVCTCVYLFEFPKEQVKDVTQINVQEIHIKQ